MFNESMFSSFGYALICLSFLQVDNSLHGMIQEVDKTKLDILLILEK